LPTRGRCCAACHKEGSPCNVSATPGSRWPPTAERPREEIGGRCSCSGDDAAGDASPGVSVAGVRSWPALVESPASGNTAGHRGGGVPSSSGRSACSGVLPGSRASSLMHRRGSKSSLAEAHACWGHATSFCPTGRGKLRGTSNPGLMLLNLSSPPPQPVRFLSGGLPHHPQKMPISHSISLISHKLVKKKSRVFFFSSFSKLPSQSDTHILKRLPSPNTYTHCFERHVQISSLQTLSL